MSQNNALVEIALALAMAFFSIMVLAMVSMGVSDNVHHKNKIVEEYIKSSMKLRASTSNDKASEDVAASDRIDPKNLVIYFQKRFFDAELKEISEHQFPKKRIKVVAVDPSIPTAEALKIRKMFGSNPVVVTLLNKVWLERLKEYKK